MLQTAFGPSCMNRASVFLCHKIFKEARESVRDDVRCGRSKEVNRPELIGVLSLLLLLLLNALHVLVMMLFGLSLFYL